MKRKLVLFGLWLAVLGLVSCATQPHPEAFDPPGFWMGIVHGLIMPFSLIGSIFTDCRIYAFPNSGGWYDFGYAIGVTGICGGGAAGSRT